MSANRILNLEETLKSQRVVSDEEASLALGWFFQSVLEADGPDELRRMFDAFYFECHKQHPPWPLNWADKSGDGQLKEDGGPGAKARGAVNGR